MNRSSRRFYRSLILSLVALGALVWVVFDQFDVPREDVLALVLGSLSLLAVTVIVAALVAGIWIAARNWLRRNDSR